MHADHDHAADQDVLEIEASAEMTCPSCGESFALDATDVRRTSVHGEVFACACGWRHRLSAHVQSWPGPRARAAA